MEVSENQVHQLISTQFPQWAHLAIRPVEVGGWDNRIFHLGEDMLVRMPSAPAYALQVEKEQLWLPKLAPFLPVQIPTPLETGTPTSDFPWKWSIYRWIEGETAASSAITHFGPLADDLAHFLLALHSINPAGGPMAGPQNFYRGGSLKVYDAQTRQAIETLKDEINVKLITQIWEAGCATRWEKKPVWVHGDISAGNLLVRGERLNAVIDFGQLGIGDPACDLVIGWTLFDEKSRKVFRDALSVDADTWARGRAWALWKALIVTANPHQTNVIEAKQASRTLEQIISE